MKIVNPFSYLLVMGLQLCIAPSSFAQDQTQLNQNIATLEENSAKIPNMIRKIIRCARGMDTCTQEEIIQARAIIGTIAAAFAVVSLGVGYSITAKAKRWWPFRTWRLPRHLQ